MPCSVYTCCSCVRLLDSHRELTNEFCYPRVINNNTMDIKDVFLVAAVFYGEPQRICNCRIGKKLTELTLSTAHDLNRL